VPGSEAGSYGYSAIDFNHDGTLLAVALRDNRGGGKILVWQVGDLNAAPREVKGSGDPTDLEFSPDGKRLAAGTYEGKVLVWDVAGLDSNPVAMNKGSASSGSSKPSTASASSIEPFHTVDLSGGSADSVAFSPDGRLLAAGIDKWSESANDYRAVVGIWDTSNWSQVQELPIGAVVQDGGASVAFSPDGATLGVASSSGAVQLWQAGSGGTWSVAREMKGASTYSPMIAFTPDGKQVAATGGSNKVFVWKMDSKAVEPERVLTVDSEGIHAIAFSPDGRTLATGGGDEDAWLYNFEDGKLLFRLRGHTSGVNSLAFSPDGEYLATGGYDELVYLWRVSDGKWVRKMEASPSAVAFTPDGRYIAAGGVWTAPRLFNTSDGALVSRLNTPPESSGSSPKVFSLAFSPDGKTLAGGIQYGEIWLWKIP
jgi:WD40 repeat protein